ncbi:hypothetical protein C8F04DRAFT_1356205, partial [Mycena alexandri]
APSTALSPCRTSPPHAPSISRLPLPLCVRQGRFDTPSPAPLALGFPRLARPHRRLPAPSRTACTRAPLRCTARLAAPRPQGTSSAYAPQVFRRLLPLRVRRGRFCTTRAGPLVPALPHIYPPYRRLPVVEVLRPHAHRKYLGVRSLCASDTAVCAPSAPGRLPRPSVPQTTSATARRPCATFPSQAPQISRPPLLLHVRRGRFCTPPPDRLRPCPRAAIRFIDGSPRPTACACSSAESGSTPVSPIFYLPPHMCLFALPVILSFPVLARFFPFSCPALSHTPPTSVSM